MNDHLKVVFDKMLPAISNGGLNYWVFGGVGVAGVAGKFLRFNADVDICVQGEVDFEQTRALLFRLGGEQGNWTVRDRKRLQACRRPKFDVLVNGTERLSVVPVYSTNSSIEFRTDKSLLTLPECALVQEIRVVAGHRFFSPPARIIKRILGSLVNERPAILKSRRRPDINYLFTPEEQQAGLWLSTDP